jgi:ABC-2 type transport system permease protein
MNKINTIHGLFKKEILLFTKKRKPLYLSILLPIALALLFLTITNPSGGIIKVGVCDYDNTPQSQNAYQQLSGFSTTNLKTSDCAANLTKGIQRGDFDLGMQIPNGFTSNINKGQQGKILVHYDNTDPAFANLISWKIDQRMEPHERTIIESLHNEIKSHINIAEQSINTANTFITHPELTTAQQQLEQAQTIETEFILNPIWTDKKPIYQNQTTKSSGLAFLFPILSLFMMLFLASSSMIYDRKSFYLTRIRSNTSPLLYLLTKLICFTALTAIQFLILFLLFLAYGATYSASIPQVLLAILAVGAINTLIGIIIGTLAENEGTALLSSLVITLPLLLLSGLFYPLQTLSPVLRAILKFSPLHYEIALMKQAILFNIPLTKAPLIIIAALFIASYLLISEKE